MVAISPRQVTRARAQAQAAALRTARAGRAGFLAALIMLAAQLVWRLYWSNGGMIHAFPEFIVAAISRLTPLSVFAAGTENYGSLAKQSLFVAVLVGVVAVGYQAGLLAERTSRRFSPGLRGRLAAGGLVAGGLLLFTGLVILPIAHEGVFARSNSDTSGVLLRLVVTFALFAVCWAILATPAMVAVSAPELADGVVTRREAVRRGAWGVATLAAVAGVGGATWRLLNPPKEKVVDHTAEILARQRATRAAQGAGRPTPTPVAQVTTHEVAALHADVDLAALQDDPTALFAQLDSDKHLTPVLTTVDDFYHVSKNLSDPEVDKKDWKLKLTGLVNKELELTYDDLVKRATTKKITTLCCISNQLNGDLISTAEWTGLPLIDLLNEAGVKAGAIKLKFHCADDYEDSIHLDRAMDPDTMVVVAMNDAPLPRDHGGPARMLVPGIYGMKNVKWLQRIEVIDEDFRGYWETRGWDDLAMNQIWGRIDYPGDGDKVKAGPVVAAGLASAGDRDVKRVEVSLDDGKTWADATLEPSLNPPFTWVRWAYKFDAQPGKYTMRIRATDGTGAVAPEERQDPLPSGATGWPSRRVEVKG